MTAQEALSSPDEEVRRAAVATLTGGDEELSLLMHVLGDESWRVRKEAALRASQWPDQKSAAAALVDTLRERDNVGRRNAAVEALSRIGAVAVPPLLHALDALPEFRKLIVDTLGLIGDPSVTPRLVPVLQDDDLNVRAAAAEALGRIGGEDAERALAEGIQQAELLVSLACLEALNALGARLPTSTVTALLVVTVMRPAALQALGNTRDPEAVSALLPSLADQSRVVREAATVAIERLFALLNSDASDAESAARFVAMTAGAIPDGAEPLLVQALLEASVPTRRAAATVLGLSNRSSAVKPLLLALGDHEVEEAATSSLLRLGSAAVVPLASAARDLDAGRRAAVLRLLPGLGTDERLASFAVAELGCGEPDVAAEAARALSEIGGVQALGPLFEALGSEELRAAAEAALTRLAGRFPNEVGAHVDERGLDGEDAPCLCRILGACRRPNDVQRLAALIQSPSVALRAAAVEALADAATTSAPAEAHALTAALDSALADKDAEVRAAATRWLATIPAEMISATGEDNEGGQDGTLARLSRAISDEDSSVRAAAARVLALRGTPDAVAILEARAATETDELVRVVIQNVLLATP